MRASLELKLWALCRGGPSQKEKQREWANELSDAEYCINVRAQEQKLLSAMRKHREARVSKKPPTPRLALGCLESHIPVPEIIIDPPEAPFIPQSDRRLWDPNTEDDDVVEALIAHSSRLHVLSSSDPMHITSRIDSEMRDRGLDSLGKHPLILQYEHARRAAIARGDPNPGDITPMLSLRTPRDRLNERLRQSHSSSSYTSSEGVQVQYGFGLSAKASSPSTSTLSTSKSTPATQDNDNHPPPTTLAYLPRNRSHTCDDRFWSDHITAQDRAEGRLAPPSLERKKETGAQLEAEIFAFALQSVDPAEGIAKYHELRRNWFASGASLSVAAMVSRGTWA